VDSIDPEAVYPYAFQFNVKHYISKGQVDRIVIKINSTKKSGIFSSRVKVVYNSENPIISKVVNLDLIKANDARDKRTVYIQG
jgi:hypothetical protein